MRILVVEDDKNLSQQLTQALEKDAYVVDTAFDGADAHFKGEVETYNVIILDLGLPVIDGITVLSKWRASGIDTPVLILTARDSWHEKVSGIDAGADDYLTKPFHMQELLARVRALIRRTGNHTSAQWSCGPITLDTAQSTVSVNDVFIDLTAQEFRVLSVLMQNKKQVVTRTDLIDYIYAQDMDRDSNTIDVFIARLRKKLQANAIKTVRGVGYMLVDTDADTDK